MPKEQITLQDFITTVAANQNYATHYGLVFSASILNANIIFKFKNNTGKDDSQQVSQSGVGAFITNYYIYKSKFGKAGVDPYLQPPTMGTAKVCDDFVNSIVRATMVRLDMDIKDITIDEYANKVSDLASKLDEAIQKLNNANTNAAALSGVVEKLTGETKLDYAMLRKEFTENVAKIEKNAALVISEAQKEAARQITAARQESIADAKTATTELTTAKALLRGEHTSVKGAISDLPEQLRNVVANASEEYKLLSSSAKTDFEAFRKKVSGEVAHLLNNAAAQVLIKDFEKSSRVKRFEAGRNKEISLRILWVCIYAVMLIAIPAAYLVSESIFYNLPTNSGYMQKMLQLLYVKLSVAIPLLGLFGYFNSREKRARQLQERYHRITIILRTMGAYVDGMKDDQSSKVRMDLSKELFSLSDLTDSKESDKAYNDALKFISAIRGGGGGAEEK